MATENKQHKHQQGHSCNQFFIRSLQLGETTFLNANVTAKFIWSHDDAGPLVKQYKLDCEDKKERQKNKDAFCNWWRSTKKSFARKRARRMNNTQGNNSGDGRPMADTGNNNPNDNNDVVGRPQPNQEGFGAPSTSVLETFMKSAEANPQLMATMLNSPAGRAFLNDAGADHTAERVHSTAHQSRASFEATTHQSRQSFEQLQSKDRTSFERSSMQDFDRNKGFRAPPPPSPSMEPAAAIEEEPPTAPIEEIDGPPPSPSPMASAPQGLVRPPQGPPQQAPASSLRMPTIPEEPTIPAATTPVERHRVVPSSASRSCKKRGHEDVLHNINDEEQQVPVPTPSKRRKTGNDTFDSTASSASFSMDQATPGKKKAAVGSGVQLHSAAKLNSAKMKEEANGDGKFTKIELKAPTFKRS